MERTPPRMRTPAPIFDFYTVLHFAAKGDCCEVTATGRTRRIPKCGEKTVHLVKIGRLQPPERSPEIQNNR